MSEGALIFECSSLVDRSHCMGFRVYLTLFLVQNQVRPYNTVIKRYQALSRAVGSGLLPCLARDTYACIMLQIHCGFTTILCLGSGQGGGCWFMTSSHLSTFASLERDRCLL